MKEEELNQKENAVEEEVCKQENEWLEEQKNQGERERS